jgi:hypothetical protein
MSKRRIIAVFIAFVLTIAATAMWSASTDEREGDPDAIVLGIPDRKQAQRNRKRVVTRSSKLSLRRSKPSDVCLARARTTTDSSA